MAPPRYACTQCASTTFEEDNGIWYCHNGHEQEGGQQIGEDDDDFMKSGRIHRQKETKEKQKISKVHRGAKGFQLFLKAWQHILWRQCYSLIHQHGLPNELWAIVRELWALRLSRLTKRIEDSTDIDLNRSSDLSSSSDPDTEVDVDTNMKIFETSRHVSDNPTLPDTIALNYMGVLLLRIPTSLSAFYNYIRQEKVCYIRAIRHVPQEIRERLAPEYHASLDTSVVPTQHDLQLAVYRTATMYGDDFGMVTPPLNWTLALRQNIQNLALPLEVFPAVKLLAKILDYNFAYPERHGKRRNATTYPEAQLMALIVVATKLLYPFDGDSVKRYPRSVNEPANLVINWQEWYNAREATQRKNDDGKLGPEHAIEITDADVLRMPDDQLDQYMDWFQRTYARDVKVNQLQQQILDMFPLQDIVHSNADNHTDEENHRRTLIRVKATQAALRLGRVVDVVDHISSPSVLLRPGQQYHQYRSLDAMPKVAMILHQEAAELACLSTSSLLKACLRTERLLILHQHEERRAEYFNDEEIDESG